MKPIIGITVEPTHDPGHARTRGQLLLNWNYAEVIAGAGGVPLLVPPMADMKEVAAAIDGWLIPGGKDIDASRYGQANHSEADLQDPLRYDGERALYEAVDPTMPILGICYGCQFLNVVRGGTLIQHLPDSLGHDRHSGGALEHFELQGESKLAGVLGDDPTGKSYHHQVVDRVGQALRVTAKSKDGVVEALEAEDRPWVVGVQWHPERSPEDPGNCALIKRFVEKAARYAQQKRCR